MQSLADAGVEFRGDDLEHVLRRKHEPKSPRVEASTVLVKEIAYEQGRSTRFKRGTGFFWQIEIEASLVGYLGFILARNTYYIWKIERSINATPCQTVTLSTRNLSTHTVRNSATRSVIN